MQSLEFGELAIRALEWSRERTRRHLAGLREPQSICGGNFKAQFKPLYNRLGIQLPGVEANNNREQEKDNSSRARTFMSSLRAEIENTTTQDECECKHRIRYNFDGG